VCGQRRWRHVTFHLMVNDFSMSSTSYLDRERHILP